MPNVEKEKETDKATAEEEKENTMKKNIDGEAADLEVQLKPILDAMAEKVIRLNKIDY
jgi:hypothetical protein